MEQMVFVMGIEAKTSLLLLAGERKHALKPGLGMQDF